MMCEQDMLGRVPRFAQLNFTGALGRERMRRELQDEFEKADRESCMNPNCAGKPSSKNG
jgi:hypothetical protein